jgi:hypothetical protein
LILSIHVRAQIYCRLGGHARTQHGRLVGRAPSPCRRRLHPTRNMSRPNPRAKVDRSGRSTTLLRNSAGVATFMYQFGQRQQFPPYCTLSRYWDRWQPKEPWIMQGPEVVRRDRRVRWSWSPKPSTSRSARPTVLASMSSKPAPRPRIARSRDVCAAPQPPPTRPTRHGHDGGRSAEIRATLVLLRAHLTTLTTLDHLESTFDHFGPLGPLLRALGPLWSMTTLSTLALFPCSGSREAGGGGGGGGGGHGALEHLSTFLGDGARRTRSEDRSTLAHSHIFRSGEEGEGRGREEGPGPSGEALFHLSASSTPGPRQRNHARGSTWHTLDHLDTTFLHTHHLRAADEDTDHPVHLATASSNISTRQAQLTSSRH